MNIEDLIEQFEFWIIQHAAKTQLSIDEFSWIEFNLAKSFFNLHNKFIEELKIERAWIKAKLNLCVVA